MTAKEIRELTKLKRNRFCEKYNIPLRTMENWENDVNQAPAYVMDLLERAVRQDFGYPSTYYVVEADDDGNEWFLMKTMNKTEAIRRAQDEEYVHQRDKIKGKRVEVRRYLEDIENEDCQCFDCDVITE